MKIDKFDTGEKQPPLKRCSGCKKRRRVWYFSKDKQTKDGLKERCKDCESIRLKKYYKEVIYPTKFKEPLTPDEDMREI